MAKLSLIYTRRLLVLVICFLFILFLSIEVYNIKLNISSNVIKFLTIVLCLIISIISSPLDNQSKDVFLLQLGLVFTVLADYTFLIHNDDYSFAIGLFAIVQIIYSLRYREGNEISRVIKFIVLYIVIAMAYKILKENLLEIDFLIAIAIFYGVCLISSLKDALLLYKKDVKDYRSKIILFAMILFLLCDTSLGLNYILSEVKIRGDILILLKEISSISIWLYYLPSQLLLAFSGAEL